MNLRPALCLPLLVLPLSACSATMSLSRYEGVTGVSWPQISVGQRVLIAPGPACDLRSGDGLASALGADKAPTSFHTAGAVVTVEQAVVNPHSERIGLAVRGDEKTEFVSVSFASKDCFYPPEIEGLARAKEAIGKRYAFTPWKPTCTGVMASGPSANSLLFEGDGGEVTADKVQILRPEGAALPLMPWVGFSASFAVPLSVFDACFESAETAKAPGDLRGFLHLSERQCSQSDYKGKAHLECTSSLGVWQVEQGPLLVASLRHQTLGTAHFLGSRLMDGEAFAKVIVGLELGQASEPKQRAVVAAMTEAVRSTLAKEAGGARVTTKDDPAATVRVAVSLADLTVGELETSEERETTTYKDHQEDVVNPRKAELEAEADRAEDELKNAAENLKDAEAKYEDTKKARERIAQECRDQAQKAGTWGGIIGGAGCGAATDAVADLALVSGARDRLAKAKTAAATSRSAARAEPATKREWVMLPWAYTKKVHRRSVSVTLDMTVTPRGGEQSQHKEPLRLDLTDYEVAADARHGVKGHAPDPNLLRDPDALASSIASQVSSRVQARLRAVLLSEERRTAADALAKAGIEVTREDNVAVDAAAFAAVGGRIVKGERRGTAKGKLTQVPVDGIKLGDGECLMLVAASIQPPDAPVILRTADKRVVDERGRGTALIEVCGPPRAFEVEIPRGGTARWTVYRLK